MRVHHPTSRPSAARSHNGIERLEGAERLISLKILDVANNRIQRLEGLDALQVCVKTGQRRGPPQLGTAPPLTVAARACPQLTDLWANDNKIDSLDDVEAALKSQRGSLSCLYLRGNPCAAGTDYKLRMKFALPQLEQLDDNPVA